MPETVTRLAGCVRFLRAVATLRRQAVGQEQADCHRYDVPRIFSRRRACVLVIGIERITPILIPLLND
jgi:hypothetical protein